MSEKSPLIVAAALPPMNVMRDGAKVPPFVSVELVVQKMYALPLCGTLPPDQLSALLSSPSFAAPVQ